MYAIRSYYALDFDLTRHVELQRDRVVRIRERSQQERGTDRADPETQLPCPKAPHRPASCSSNSSASHAALKRLASAPVIPL